MEQGRSRDTVGRRYAPAALLATTTPAAGLLLLLDAVPALTLRMSLVATGIAAVVIGLRIHAPARRRPWLLVVAALSASFCGDAVALRTLLRGELTSTVPADAWLTAAAGLLLVAAVLDATGSRRRSDVGGLLDALAVALAAGTLVWSVLIVPAAAPGWVGSSVEIAGSIQILLFAALTALVVRSYRRVERGRRVSMGLAVCALLCATTAFLLGALTDAGSAVPYTGARALFGAIANLMMGAAALHPSMHSFTEPPRPVPEPLTGARTARLGAALSAPVLVLVWSEFANQPLSVVVVTGAWVLLVPTVLARLYLLGRDQAAAEQRGNATERRLAALVAHTGDVLLLVRARDGAHGIDYASPAATSVLGRDPDSLVGDRIEALVVPDDHATVAEVLHAGHERLSTADVRAIGPAGEPRWVQVIADRHTGADEPGALVVTLRDVTDRKREEQRWVEAALCDPATGLANRRAIEEQLRSTLDTQAARAGAVGVLMCDLDDFKRINDRFGHAVGDQVLREVADRLRGAVRQDDLVGRLGGDEFVVVSSVAVGHGNLEELAARIVADIGRPFEVAGAPLVLGASVGIATTDARTRTAPVLLDQADRALYLAKAAGKNRVAWSGSDRTERGVSEDVR